MILQQSVGEAFTADTDTFQDTVASQLIQDQGRVDDTGSLLLVGDDTTNEVLKDVDYSKIE